MAHFDILDKNVVKGGSIVAGNTPGRKEESERILAINIGLALNDIIVANHIYEIAKKRNSYRKLRLL